MVVEPVSNNRIKPLSSSQSNIYHVELLNPGLPTNNICVTLSVKGQIQIPLMIKSVAVLLETTPVLNYRVTERNGEAFQYLSEISAAPAPFYDFTLTRQDGLSNWENSIATSPIPLYDAPLFFCAVFRIAPDEGGFLIKTHHLISDAWSHMLLADRIARIYMNFLAGNEKSLPPIPDYADHIAQEQAYLASSEYSKDRLYWNEQLSDLPITPLREKSGAERSPVGQRLSFVLPDRLNFQITDFCDKRKVSPFAVFLLAFSLYINRTRGLEKFCIGVPIINRRNIEEKQSIGMFVNTLPFISSVSGEDTLTTLNEKLQNDWYSLLKHQRVPYQDIASIAHDNGREGAMFDVVLSYQNGHMQNLEDTDIRLAGHWHYSGYQIESLCIHASNREDETSFLLDYDFLTQVFSSGEIEQMHEECMRLLLDALRHPDKHVYELSLMSPQMEETVLYTFNHTKLPTLVYKDIASALAATAGMNPRRAAVISGGSRLTYGSLYKDAMVMAGKIASLYPDGKKVIALLYPRDTSLFTAFCAVSLSGNTYLLLDETMPPARISEYIRQSGASLLLGNDDLIRSLGYKAVQMMNTCELQALEPGPIPISSQDDLAYLVFTSGSTGLPKAVAISQRNLLAFASAMRPLYADGAVLSLCAVCFDAFIIESLAALINAQTVVLATEDERNEPESLAALIRDYAVGFIAVTPSRLTTYIQNTNFRQSLVRVESIVCGGEAFPPQLFSKLSGSTGARIYNQYGPSEATVGITSKLICEDTKITVGSPMSGSRIYILDAHGQPLPIGSIGEIYIGGTNVAQGYFGDKALTEKCFRPDPFYLKGRMYHTGDLGEWTTDGELKLYGRIDEQFKINGTRFEPAEIAAYLTTYPGVKEAAVRLLTMDNRKVLTAYYTDGKAPEPDELLSFAAAYLPRAVVPQYAVRLNALPVTVNGKLDAARLPLPSSTSVAEDAMDEIEQKLLRFWRLNLKRADILVNSDYYASGGDSLSAISLLQEIEKVFHYNLPLSVLNANSTVRKLAGYIRGGALNRSVASSFPLAPVQSSYRLTAQQESFFVLYQLDTNSLAYNMPGAFAFTLPVDEVRLQSAFEKMTMDDDCFRTGFRFASSGTEQFTLDTSDFKLERLTAKDFQDACRQFIRPFDLSKPPLIRAALWDDGYKGQVLLLDIHHILSDGISSALMIRRLDNLYHEYPVVLPRVRMRDIAWQSSQQPQEKLEQQRDFWKHTLENAPPYLAFPTDYPYPLAFDMRGAKVRGKLPLALANQANDYCIHEKITPFTLFISVFTSLLFRLSGQDDIIVGTPVSLRTHPELNDVIGALISTFPLRSRLAKDLSFRDHVKNTQKNFIEVLDNRLISYDEIISISGVERDRARNPLCNIVFSYLPVDDAKFEIGGSKLINLPLDSGITKFDFSLEIAPKESGYSYTWEYAASLFDQGTIEILARAFPAALESVLSDQDILMKDIMVSAPSDMIRLISKPHRTRTPYEQIPVDEMIDRQAAINPTGIAISWGDNRQYTYRQVSARSNALASMLLSSGITPGSCVGLLSRRNGDMAVALLGILKAGCSYLPLDYTYPSDRMAYMLTEANAQALLLDADLSAPDGCLCRVIPLDFSIAEPFSKPTGRQMSDAFFVLYTSGTTGRPKGVTVLHKGVSNLLCDVAPLLDFDDCRILCAANVIFDIFTTETMLAWSLGKQVVMCDENEMLLPIRMAERIEKGDVNVLQLTPSRMQMCLSDNDFKKTLGRIRLIILAGEPFSTQLLDSIRSVTSARIINIYGPTETTVFSTYADLTRSSYVTIGKPVANTRIYALDDAGRIVPPLCQGEVYIAGEGVGGGYIGRDDLTRQQFFPDPFFPGDMMYRTGDLARLRHDGNWMLYGRRDHQIKMNGHRIEPGEICEQMLKSCQVLEAAVVPEIINKEVKSLRAYIVPAPQYSVSVLREYLSQQLPAYMIPATFTPLTALPRTPSGKTDLLALASYVKSGSATARPDKCGDQPVTAASADNKQIENVEPARETTPVPNEERLQTSPLETITRIWQTELSHEVCSVSQSFFEMGGSSITALKVLTAYYNLGYQMSYSDFTKDPTIKGHVSIITGLPFCDQSVDSMEQVPDAREAIPAADTHKADSTDNQKESRDETTDQAVQATPSADAITSAAPVTNLPRRLSTCIVPVLLERDLLLTGASGYLGAHLLKELLKKGFHVHCLVRDEKRLSKALHFYFGSALTIHDPRITIVRGDIALPDFGLTNDEYNALAKRIGVVIHAAADVRHNAPDHELLLTNVTGTQNVIAFSKTARARLLYISTASVCGNHLVKTPCLSVKYTEKDLDIGQNWQDNAYVRSKILAEASVSLAIGEGLSAHIFRVGRLAARASDGLFQQDPSTNAFFRLMKGMEEINAVPASLANLEMELTPVDCCANAIIALMADARSCSHLLSPNRYLLIDILSFLASTEVLPDAAFRDRVRAACVPGASPYLQSLAETTLGGELAPQMIKLDSAETERALAARGFVWSNPGISKLLSTFKDGGKV
jgi:amino acid adenylation domain-containing protein/thioester reductase-like protein